jgi:lysophospholipase L1-like esterase
MAVTSKNPGPKVGLYFEMVANPQAANQATLHTMSDTHPKRVLLLGDSTVLGSVPRLFAPMADNLEDVMRKRLASDASLPPVLVINKGQDNDTIHRMLDNRYDRDVARLPGGPPDFIFIRFGINDFFYLPDWPAQFQPNYRRLIANIRRDVPSAFITLETIIPYSDAPTTHTVNEAIRAVAAAEKLPVCDTHAALAAALAHGPQMFTYRRVGLAAIPHNLRPLLPEGSISDDCVTILDHALDPHFSSVPDWFADRHPNHAGFHVIGKCVADYLAGCFGTTPQNRN